jgi:hypothetical protein
MAGQPFGTSAGRPEGVAYRVRHEHRATPLSGRAVDLFTSSQSLQEIHSQAQVFNRPYWMARCTSCAFVGTCSLLRREVLWFATVL